MQTLTIKTQRRTDFVNVTREVQNAVTVMGIRSGVVTVFNPHTTAGLTINENADPDVVTDLGVALDRIVPWDAGYRHAEGNSAAHLKASMMGSSLQLIVCDGVIQLGTWQGIYFCEFDGPRNRRVWVSSTADNQ